MKTVVQKVVSTLSSTAVTHRRLVVAAALLLAAAQIARFLWDPQPTVPQGRVRWLELAFADPTCGASWWLGRQTDAENPWSTHPGDDRRHAKCVSAPIVLGPERYLVLQYAGDPGDTAVKLSLDLGGDGEHPFVMTPSDSARHGWLVGFTELPQHAAGQTARLVIDDASDKPLGWLAVRRLGQSDVVLFGSTSTHLLPPTLTILLVPILVLLGTFYSRRSVWLGAAPLLAAAALLFLRFRAFYNLDEYDLLLPYAAGNMRQELLSHFGHVEPIFLSLYAAAVSLARANYQYLQLGMLFLHVAVVLLLVRLLDSNGFDRALGPGLAALFAITWTHVGVVSWFMELSFVLSTALTLAALLSYCSFANGGGKGKLLLAIAITAVAPFSFSAGLLTPWLVAAYSLLRDRRHWRLALVFIAIGALVFAAALGLGGADQTVAGSIAAVSLADRLAYLMRGMFHGSLFGLIGLRNNATVGTIILLAAIPLLAYAYRRWPWRREHTALALFGLVWLLASYILQTAARADLGADQATKFSYAYLGMTAAAFLVAALLTAFWRSLPPTFSRVGRNLILCGGAIALVIVLGMDARKAIKRANEHEREYYELGFQQYVLTAALQRSQGDGGRVLGEGRMLKSSGWYSLAQLSSVVRFLSNDSSRGAVAAAGSSASLAAPAADDTAGWEQLLGTQ